jgi:hypothetical protein
MLWKKIAQHKKVFFYFMFLILLQKVRLKISAGQYMNKIKSFYTILTPKPINRALKQI